MFVDNVTTKRVNITKFRGRTAGPERREVRERVAFGLSFASWAGFRSQGHSGAKSPWRGEGLLKGLAGAVDWSPCPTGVTSFLGLPAGVHRLLCAGGARAVSASRGGLCALHTSRQAEPPREPPGPGARGPGGELGAGHPERGEGRWCGRALLLGLGQLRRPQTTAQRCSHWLVLAHLPALLGPVAGYRAGSGAAKGRTSCSQRCWPCPFPTLLCSPTLSILIRKRSGGAKALG